MSNGPTHTPASNSSAERHQNRAAADWETSSLSKLIDHLLLHHHPYTRSSLESLAPLLDKVLRVHGDAHPELHKLSALFRELHSDMDLHLMKEEHILFPYMQGLENSTTPPPPHFGTVANPIRMMTMEHQHDSLILHEIRAVTRQFTTPPGACSSYTDLYTGLEELVDDLFRHIQLENDFLFPKAIEAEATALRGS